MMFKACNCRKPETTSDWEFRNNPDINYALTNDKTGLYIIRCNCYRKWYFENGKWHRLHFWNIKRIKPLMDREWIISRLGALSMLILGILVLVSIVTFVWNNLWVLFLVIPATIFVILWFKEGMSWE